MKTTSNLVILSILMGLWVAACDEISCDYEAYLEKFGKQYSPSEKQKRKPIFQTNCADLLKIELQANGAYHVSLNNFTDRTEAEMAELLNTPSQDKLNKIESARVGSFIHGLDELQPPAASIDYRNYNGKNYVTSAKNQGACGSCWSFTTASFFQSYYLLKGGSSTPDFSEQYILECSGAGTCKDGGYTQLSIEFGIVAGMVSEKSLGYEGAAQGMTVSECKNLNKIFFPTAEYPYFRKYYYLEDEELKSILTNYGPISVAMYASGSSFIGYSSGVYNGCPSETTINHGALLVGYDEDGNWIIKNSWGSQWGQGGFATISKDYNCGIDTYADFLIFNNGVVLYSLQLRDAGADGYNGWVFGLKNKDTEEIEFEFGRNFTEGSQLNISDIEISLNQSYEIVIVQNGTLDNKLECSFILKNQDGVVVHYLAPKFDFQSPITEFCPDCNTLEFVPIAADSNGTSADETYKLLMFVFIGVSGVLLVSVISMVMIICKLRRNSRLLAEKCIEFKEKQSVTQDSKKAYGFDTESGKNGLQGGIYTANGKLQKPVKRKAPLPRPLTQIKSQPKNQAPHSNNSQNSAQYLKGGKL